MSLCGCAAKAVPSTACASFLQVACLYLAIKTPRLMTADTRRAAAAAHLHQQQQPTATQHSQAPHHHSSSSSRMAPNNPAAHHQQQQVLGRCQALLPGV